MTKVYTICADPFDLLHLRTPWQVPFSIAALGKNVVANNEIVRPLPISFSLTRAELENPSVIPMYGSTESIGVGKARRCGSDLS